MQRVLALDPVHDSRHRLRPGPLARESLVWMLQLPDEQIAAFVYTWVSGESKAGTALCVYGPGIAAGPIFEIVDGIPVPEDQAFDDWRVGGLHSRHGEALGTADVTFTGERASVEYRFEAMHPAYAYGMHRDGCPPWMADERFEQGGRVSGVLRVRGREIGFDTFGHRDHSWGTRDWMMSQHWKWLEAQAGPDTAVHLFEFSALGRTHLRGYVYRDGVMAEVTAADVDFERDERLYHTSIEVVLHDDAGRSTTVTGTTFAVFEFPVAPTTTLNECSMSVEIEGEPGVGHVEMQWPKDYLDHVREAGA
jgi:hypothetical protein